MSDSTDKLPPTTVVLLGASNLTRGISTVVETLGLQHDSLLRIVAALGHGRSFGMRSSVLGRSLCSMLDCGLWQALDDSPPPALALLTDIGNDIMYGASPASIASWLDTCIDRLASRGVERINITALPLSSIRRVKPWQYAIVRAILFPTHDITFEHAVANAMETQHRVEQLVERRGPGVRLIHHEGDWYGFDPIHIRARHWPVAWGRFLARDDAHIAVRARGSWSRWRRLRSHMPQQYALLGMERSHPQPLSLPGGTTIEMY